MKIGQFGQLAKLLLIPILLMGSPVLADDLSNGSWNTLDSSNTATPPNGFPAGMFPNQLEPALRAVMGGTKRWWERANPALSTTGSAGAYVLTPTNPSFPTALSQGEIYCAKANFTSVGSDTLNVNSLGAKAIYANNGTSLAQISAGNIISGEEFCAAYDAVLNGGAGGFQLLTTFVPNLAGLLKGSNNLSDVSSASTSRTNLGLKNGATATITVSTSSPSGTPADGDLWIKY